MGMAKNLIAASLTFYKNELHRKEALEQLQSWRSIVTEEYTLANIAIRPDGSTSVHTRSGHRIPVQIVELKNEIGEGGSDPIMQAERSYASIFCSPRVSRFLPHTNLLLKDHS